jgi:hypothetical protein
MVNEVASSGASSFFVFFRKKKAAGIESHADDLMVEVLRCEAT